LIYKNEKNIERILKTKHGQQRLMEILNECKNIQYCQSDEYGCGRAVPRISITRNYCTLYLKAETQRKSGEDEEGGADGRKKIITMIQPEMCYNILKNVRPVDLRILGMDPDKSRPEDMIIKVFPVPPVQVRPSIKSGIYSSEQSEDDLTHKIADIVRTNDRLRHIKNDPTRGTTDNSYYISNVLLQYHVTTFYDNKFLGIPRCEQKKKEFKSMSERLKGKEGRVRGNMMGKRVDKSARTVITSDPNIAINQVGVPIRIAMNLTFPEHVTDYNINYLSKLVENGPYMYPGANIVSKFMMKDGIQVQKNIMLKNAKTKPRLNPGDKVYRHLINDDPVLFNRQPSLHKMSMMGHFVDVITDTSLNTFRLNVTVTSPYGAD
jgi:DNA-directed RNA polymerase II subunit RPB1